MLRELASAQTQLMSVMVTGDRMPASCLRLVQLSAPDGRPTQLSRDAATALATRHRDKWLRREVEYINLVKALRALPEPFAQLPEHRELAVAVADRVLRTGPGPYCCRSTASASDRRWRRRDASYRRQGASGSPRSHHRPSAV